MAYRTWRRRLVNPFTESRQPSRYNFRAEKCTHTPAKCIFRSYNKSTFNTVRFTKIHLQANAKKKTKIVSGFQIWPFYWSFSSDTIAVKGLSTTGHLPHNGNLEDEWHVHARPGRPHKRSKDKHQTSER